MGLGCNAEGEIEAAKIAHVDDAPSSESIGCDDATKKRRVHMPHMHHNKP